MTSVDSSFAGSMKAQVLMTTVSARPASDSNRHPGAREFGDHHLGIHEILRTAKAYECNASHRQRIANGS